MTTERPDRGARALATRLHETAIRNHNLGEGPLRAICDRPESHEPRADAILANGAVFLETGGPAIREALDRDRRICRRYFSSTVTRCHLHNDDLARCEDWEAGRLAALHPQPEGSAQG